MAFELFQLHVLKNTPNGNTPVGVIPSQVSTYLGCNQTMAYFSSVSIRHVLAKHPDLDMLELLHMPNMVERGLWMTDKNKRNMAVVIYQPPDTSPRYISALKVTGEGFEPYMCSFYRLRDRDYQAKLKRGTILRPHL